MFRPPIPARHNNPLQEPTIRADPEGKSKGISTSEILSKVWSKATVQTGLLEEFMARVFYFLDTFVLCLVFFGPIFVLQGPKLYAPRSLECVFHISSDKENWLAHILAKYTNGLFECHEFGNVFGFEELEIQILCSNKLKELDLDLAPNPTRIWLAKIHRFQIPLNTVEFLKSFTHSPLSLYLGPCFSLFLTMQQASSSLSLVLLSLPHNASFFFSLFRDNL